MLAYPELEPELRDRLLLDPAAFDAFLMAYLGAVPTRDFGPAQLDLALAYPWERPVESYVLRDGEFEVGDPPDELTEGRHPILAFGSNGAPSTLKRKFAHFDDPRDRTIAVRAGHLHDFDVGAAASVAVYGAMPATLFASPGTRVRAAILYTTDAQATQLTWSELTYVFGRLEARFDGEPHTVLAYASRFGTFCPDGAPVALAAIPAEDRIAPARTQEELLTMAARLALGDEATAEDLVRAVFTDLGGIVPKLRDHVRPLAQAFVADGWTPFSG